MYQGKSILGVIPARAASKRVPGKNTRPFAGKPLIAWTIEAAQNCALLDEVVLSSDDDAAIDIARGLGCSVPFKRAPHLATDEVTTAEVILDVLERLPGRFDYVVILQPTSPLRRPADIEAAIQLCVDAGAAACISVARPAKPLSFYAALGANGSLTKGAVSLAGEGEAMVLNGAVYVIDIPEFQRTRTIPSTRVVGYEMPTERSVDIDEPWEFAAAEAIAKSGDA